MKNSRIGLIGYSVRAAAEALAPSHDVVLAVDAFGDRDLQQLLPGRWMAWAGFDDWVSAGNGSLGAKPNRSNSDSTAESLHRPSPALQQAGISWINTGGLDLDRNRLAALAPRPHALAGCSMSATEFCKSPELWTSCLETSGFDFPAVSFQDRCPPGRWFLKRGWPESKHPWFWQEAVEGELGSALFLTDGTTTLLIGCGRLYVDAQFQYVGNVVGWGWLDDSGVRLIAGIGARLAAVGGLRGLFGVDFMANGTVRLLEINPRPTASVEAWAKYWGVNFFAQHVQVSCENVRLESLIRVATGEGKYAAVRAPRPRDSSRQDHVFTLHPLDQHCHSWVAKRIIYNRGERIRVTSRQSDLLMAMREGAFKTPLGKEHDAVSQGPVLIDSARSEFRVADIPSANTVIPSGAPICTLLCWSGVAEGPRTSGLARGMDSAGPVSAWTSAGRLAEEVVDRVFSRAHGVEHSFGPGWGDPA